MKSRHITGLIIILFLSCLGGGFALFFCTQIRATCEHVHVKSGQATYLDGLICRYTDTDIAVTYQDLRKLP